ncbi:Ig-like domain-containing protein [Candidatus Marinimicrobia bacterium]|nr:Ig-like domain-containing protein [Candidatus Neomarinimicrobiota bacterium]
MRKILLLLPFFLWTCGGGSTEPEPPQLPTVTNIEVTTLEDTAKTFALTGTDPNNLALTYSISTQPQHGTISISGGAATYSPNANYHGQDVITYLASSTNGNSNIGTIIITITPVDDEPNTMDVTATTDEDNSVTITLEAEEYDGENIEFQVRNNPSNGSVTISGTTATYTPNQNWFGTDTFNFEAVDSNSRNILNFATATITVNSVNDIPTVDDIDGIEAMLTQSIDIALSGLDVDGDNLSYSIVTQPSNGTIESINNNIVKFTPNKVGEDSFTFQANDGNANSNNVGTVNIYIEYFNRIINQNSNNQTAVGISKTDEGYLVVYDENDNGSYLPSKGIIINENLDTVRSFELGGDLGEYESLNETKEGNFILSGIWNGNDIHAKLIDSNGGIVNWKTFNIEGTWSKAFHASQISDGFIITGVNYKNGQHRMLVIKTNENLEMVWLKEISKYNYSDYGYEVYETSDGGFIIAGSTSSGGASSMNVLKINNSGEELWSQDFNLATGAGLSLKITNDNGFVIAGRSSIYVGSGGGGNRDTALIRKIDSSGNEEWSYEISDDIGQYFTNVEILSNDDIVAIGRASNNPFEGDWDMFAVKFSSTGNLLWSKLIGSSGDQFAYDSYEILSTNELILVGNDNQQDSDVWVVKLNLNE